MPQPRFSSRRTIRPTICPGSLGSSRLVLMGWSACWHRLRTRCLMPGVMDSNGIATSVVSISAPGVYFEKDLQLAKELSRQTNEICARLIADHPHRFGAFATLPVPDVEAALEELQYAFDVLQLDGVILL